MKTTIVWTNEEVKRSLSEEDIERMREIAIASAEREYAENPEKGRITEVTITAGEIEDNSFGFTIEYTWDRPVEVRPDAPEV